MFLKQLTLQNVAVMDALTVPLGPGFTVMTGEPGAGKSVLLDAIGWAFGAPLSPRETLRAGADQGRVELLLDLDEDRLAPEVQAFLAEAGIELAPDENELLLSREITATSSRSRINGTPVNRATLETLQALCLECQSQHALTNLFRPAYQRECLDSLGGAEVQRIKACVGETYRQWAAISEQLRERQADEETLRREHELKRFQAEELLAAELTTDDEDVLCRETLNRLTHAETLLKQLGEAVALLSGEDLESPGVGDTLGRVGKLLRDASALDTALAPLYETSVDLQETVKHLASELARTQERVSYDPEAIHAQAERLDALEQLKRKYGPTLAEVLTQRDALTQWLESQADPENSLAALHAQCAAAEAELATHCQDLTTWRHRLAGELSQQVVAILSELAMPGVRLEVALSPNGYTAEGAESVEFLFSANPGEPLRPLAKVASGGELSRLLLAFSGLSSPSVADQVTGPAGIRKIFVFDEIDTGTSGAAAQAMAQQLLRLAKTQGQVLAVTHQPLVAAVGDAHLHLEKQVFSDRVSVDVHALHTQQARLTALGKLAGGSTHHHQSVESYAASLLDHAASLKAS